MSVPLRVLIVIKSLGPGGAERLVVDQLRSTDPSAFAYELFVARPREPNLVGEVQEIGVPLHLGYGHRRPWPLVLRSVVRDGAFDVVHSHLPIAAAAARCVVRTLSSPRRPRPSLVYTEHNRWPSHRPLTRWLNRATIRLEDRVLAVSQDAAASIGWPARRPVTVVQHGVEPMAHRRTEAARHRLRDELGVGRDSMVIGTVANLRREKSQATLLRAFARAGLGDGVTLALVGQGPLADELERLADRLELGDRARFLGYRSDAIEVMAGFDLFTLPSAHEGRPVALMEAMALGLPVVVTPAGGMVDMVADGISGLVVPVGDPAALARAFRTLAEDDALRSRLARGAAAAARDLGSRAAFDAIEKHYRELAGAVGERSRG